MNMEELKIKDADVGDIPGILNVQRTRLIDNLLQDKNLGDISREGFLVHPLDENSINHLMEGGDSSIIKVLKNDSEIIGYIVLYDIKFLEDERLEKFGELIGKNVQKKSKILYGKHSAIKKGLGIKGAGTKLENDAFSYAKSLGYDYLVIEIAKSIKRKGQVFANDKSMQYHTEHRGFQKIGEIIYQDGNDEEVWNLMIKRL